VSVRRGVTALAVAAALLAGAGCAETSGRDGSGAYVDDSAITTMVKARLAEDKTVDADAIQVETANGNVVLSGVARTPLEKSTAESIAMKVRGVKTIQNNVALRP
jgi:hyperosmotically inducible periplasmic protein